MKNLTSKGKHIVLYIVTTNQKSVIDMSTKKEKESKHNGNDSHKLTREENKRRKGAGGEDLQKQTPNNKQNSNKNIHIDNYFKCEQTKCFNQKTKTGLLDTKTIPIYMLTIKNSLQI